MKLAFAPLVLAALAAAAPAVEKRAPSPLDVKLELTGNSMVKATLTNNGKNNLKVLKSGTILDDSTPVEKATVLSGDKAVEFDGLRIHVNVKSLQEDSFAKIASGESVEVTFDIAEVHDLSAGGKFDILTSGVLSFAEGDSNELVGSVPFESNKVQAEINGEEASAARVAFHQKRTSVQSDCTGTRLSVTRTALSNCARLSTAAANIATSGSASKVTEYFKSATSSVRNTVASVLRAVATECSSTSSGVSRYYCSDVYGACSSGVIAYTLPSASYMAYCPLFFNQMPALSSTCHAQDQATTVLHEATHLRQIKGTDDYGGYGYSFVRSLSASQNLNHADTYALFAQSIYAGC